MGAASWHCWALLLLRTAQPLGCPLGCLPASPYCPSNQLPLPCPPPRSPPTLLLLLLQIYPRTFIGEASMYEKGWWQMLVQGWEVMVFNPGGCAVMWWCLL